MQEKILELNGKKLFYRTLGDGPPVLLVHGFAEEGGVWKNIHAAFDGYQLVIPDLPGSGRSEAASDLSMEGMADTLFGLWQALKLELCILIGHSMGGYIALAFAERHPEALSRLGLFHSSAFADTEEKKQIRRKGILFIREHGAFEFLKTATPNLYSPVTKETKPQLITEQLDSLRDFSAEALIAYYEAMMARPDRTLVLKDQPAPVLFILGRHDAAVLLADGLKQCHLPAASSVHILENSGHMGMQEEPEKAVSALKLYLNL